MSDATISHELRDLTTMQVGGVAQRILVATSSEELVAAATEALESGHPWCVLAGGSNSIFSDEGFPGTVILVRSHGIELVAQPDAGNRVRLRVQAGHDWDDFVEHTVEQGWSGIEALSGIPGSVGAAPIQNIGAYGQEVASSLISVDFFDADSREVRSLGVDELELGYRTSVFKRGRRGVVLAVEFELHADPEGLSEPVAYAQLAQALNVDLGARVRVRDVREQVLALRASKGMVLSVSDPDTRSVGSFFVNPVVSAPFAADLPEAAPRWPAGRRDGVDLVKLSAAWLIEYAGIHKGFHLPGSAAAVSSKHSLALANRGGATAEQVGELARFIIQRVQQDTGVLLHPEPVLYGIEL